MSARDVPDAEIDTDGTSVHRVYFGEEDGREFWECITCCSQGSGGTFSPPAEVLAQRAHDRHGGNVKVVETSRRPE